MPHSCWRRSLIGVPVGSGAAKVERPQRESDEMYPRSMRLWAIATPASSADRGFQPYALVRLVGGYVGHEAQFCEDHTQRRVERSEESNQEVGHGEGAHFAAFCGEGALEGLCQIPKRQGVGGGGKPLAGGAWLSLSTKKCRLTTSRTSTVG